MDGAVEINSIKTCSLLEMLKTVELCAPLGQQS
jgi:hypothetical protein